MTSSDPSRAGSTGPVFPKRFYAAATTARDPGGVALLLDDRPARTPARNPLVVPNQPVADALADEWNAVEARIDPREMPMTRLVNSVIDGVSRTPAAVLDEIRRYGESDLLLYRAPGPAELAAAQAAAWDGVLAWAHDSLQVELAIGEGITFIAQPPSALDRLGQALAACVGSDASTSFKLGALHVMTTLTGSALLALAVAHGRLRDDEAWSAAHVDEDFQISQWGPDEEASLRRHLRWIEMHTAARLDRLLRS